MMGYSSDIIMNALTPREEFYDEQNMFTRIRAYAESEHLEQTYRALDYMRNCHKDQYRKRKKFASKKIPYINHPLLMACQAHALGIRDDVILCSVLLHDVVEDTDVNVTELPFSDEVKEIVGLLTFSVPDGMDKEAAKEVYYRRIRGNEAACFIKLLDRCNNVSTMAAVFSEEKLRDYIVETEVYVLPLADILKNGSLRYNDASFLLKYHILSVIETAKNLILKREG